VEGQDAITNVRDEGKQSRRLPTVAWGRVEAIVPATKVEAVVAATKVLAVVAATKVEAVVDATKVEAVVSAIKVEAVVDATKVEAVVAATKVLLAIAKKCTWVGWCWGEGESLSGIQGGPRASLTRCLLVTEVTWPWVWFRGTEECPESPWMPPAVCTWMTQLLGDCEEFHNINICRSNI